MLRGTSAGLEFVFGAQSFGETANELAGRIRERAEFYRGGVGTIVLDGTMPSETDFARFLDVLATHEIAVRGIFGDAGIATLAEAHGLAYLGAPSRPTVANLQPKLEAQAERRRELTQAARSLQADFAGARADLAERRAKRGVPPTVGRTGAAPPRDPPPVPALRSAAAAPHTQYHRGTLRGGQSLRHRGNIVVVGDVNPGAELVASGDIVVFGALRGTAHAGAEGDVAARVMALELVPTQLRIASYIAVGDEPARRIIEPEVAYVEKDRIAIAPRRKAP